MRTGVIDFMVTRGVIISMPRSRDDSATEEMVFEDIPVKIVRKKVKNLRITVHSDCTVRLTIPKGCDPLDLLEQKRDWIFDKIENNRILRERCESRSDKMLLFGREFSMQLDADLKKGCYIDTATMTIHYASVADFIKFVKKALEDRLGQRICMIASSMGVSGRIGNIRIKKQRSRWASCSHDNNLNFNIRMASLPLKFFDYIIAHELAHIIEKNHSPRFWAIVERHCSNYRICRKHLKEYWVLCNTNVYWKALIEQKKN